MLLDRVPGHLERDRVEDLLFRGEVVVEARALDSHRICDATHACRVVALISEVFGRRGQYVVTSAWKPFKPWSTGSGCRAAGRIDVQRFSPLHTGGVVLS